MAHITHAWAELPEALQIPGMTRVLHMCMPVRPGLRMPSVPGPGVPGEQQRMKEHETQTTRWRRGLQPSTGANALRCAV